VSGQARLTATPHTPSCPGDAVAASPTNFQEFDQRRKMDEKKDASAALANPSKTQSGLAVFAQNGFENMN
jgi:hypothetical protein